MSADMLDTLKGLLGDDAEDKIRTVLSSLGAGTASAETPATTEPENPINLETLEYITKLKSIAEEIGAGDDARSELLKSLRPFMRTERQQSIDTAIKLLNLSKFSGLLNL